MTGFARTSRILLRSWKKDDLAPFAEMNSDPEVMRFFPSVLAYERTLEFYERITKNMEADGYGLFAAELLSTGEFMGFIGFSRPRFEAWFTPCVEIGWRLARKFWGAGLAPEGAKACLELGFGRFGFEKVYSFTSEINAPSIRVMEKIGLSRAGAFDHPSVAEGPLKKHVLYMITKDAYIAGSSQPAGARKM